MMIGGYPVRYLFLGVDEFRPYQDTVHPNFIERSIYGILDYEFARKEIGEFYQDTLYCVKPRGAFSMVVAKALIDYQKKYPEREVHVAVVSEFKEDFENLPPQNKEIVESLKAMSGPSGEIFCQVKGTDGESGAPARLVKGMTNLIYVDERKRRNYDKLLASELKSLELKCNESVASENLYLVIQDYYRYDDERRHPSVRKRSSDLLFSYRINVKLPNGERFVEDKGGFISGEHAAFCRRVSLYRKMLQCVPMNTKNLCSVALEYLSTKEDKPSIYKKYLQYYKSFIENDPCYKKLLLYLINTAEVHGYIDVTDISYCVDGRAEDSDNEKYLSESYIQGYYRFLTNVFDYAYLQGYIEVQPTYIARFKGQ